MGNKNDFSTTFLKVGMKFTNAEKLVNYLVNKSITLSGTVLLAMLGSKQMYEILLKKCSCDAKIVIADSKLVTYYFRNKKNITCVTIKENDVADFYNKLKNMPKFDFVVQNPPYSGSLHLDFLKKGYEILSDKGQMIIIEPASWLINVRKNGKANKYNELKKMVENQVKRIVIDNYNNEFNIQNDVPFSITYIDKTYKSNDIEYILFGVKTRTDSLYNCNLIGNYNTIWSILNKIKYDKVNNHLYLPNKSEKIVGNYFCKYAEISAKICALGKRVLSDTMYRKCLGKDYMFAYSAHLFHSDTTSDIQNYPNEKRNRGGKKIEGSESECITGTKNELENWKYFVFNNTLPLFINIVMTIDCNNNSLDYVPWLVDKKYTDQEIYDMFNFTDEEIKLIETTVKKYERISPWFMRYMLGVEYASDEKVQKFIEDLNNAEE